MLLSELQQHEKGTYAGLRLDENSIDNVQQFMKDIDVPNALLPADLHTTLLYSRKYLPNYQPRGKLTPPMVAIPKELTIWESQTGERCLVLKLDSEECVNRHKELMEEHEATFDYDEYEPHITLSYNVGEKYNPPTDVSFDSLGTINFVNEYAEELKLDWASDKS